jgi:RNA polymerase sigma-70 factor (ECF subfamily)
MPGDELLLELERLHSRSFAWSLACCRGDRAEAEEVLQTVYLKILDGRAVHQGLGELVPWLYAVIRRTAADRRRRAALARLWFGGSHDAAATLAAADDPARDAERGEAASRLRTLLGTLSRRQREVLDLVFWHGLTLAETAAALGLSVGAVRRHYHRGKSRLRAALAGAPRPQGAPSCATTTIPS